MSSPRSKYIHIGKRVDSILEKDGFKTPPFAVVVVGVVVH